MDTTVCPQCDALAEVLWRAVLASTDGPIEHARICCVRGHWFLMPVAALARTTRHDAPWDGSQGAQYGLPAAVSVRLTNVLAPGTVAPRGRL